MVEKEGDAPTNEAESDAKTRTIYKELLEKRINLIAAWVDPSAENLAMLGHFVPIRFRRTAQQLLYVGSCYSCSIFWRRIMMKFALLPEKS